MKKNITMLGAVLVLATTFTACHDELGNLEGQGTVYLTAKINSDVKVQSRGDVSDYADNCLIYISNNKGLVRRFKGISEVPANGIQLVSDHYIAEGWAGDSVSALLNTNGSKAVRSLKSPTAPPPRWTLHAP